MLAAIPVKLRRIIFGALFPPTNCGSSSFRADESRDGMRALGTGFDSREVVGTSMPLLPCGASTPTHRLPVWTLILAVVTVPLMGVFTWSCYQPIEIGVRWRCVSFGRVPDDAEATSDPRKLFISASRSDCAWWGVKLPGGRKTG